MKRYVILLFLTFTLQLKAQTDTDSAYVRDNYQKIEKYITMRDGVRLFTSIYVPKDQSKKYPLLLNRTPYTVAPYGADNYKKTLGPSMLFAREGYIFVYQDVRGKWMSEGTYEDIRPHAANRKSKKDIDESTDTYDTIDWLIKNIKGNNGKAGIYGISYPGFYSTAALPGAHPALKAASPQAPVTDWFRGDDFHHNGALFLSDGFSFYSSFGVPRPKPVTPEQGGKRVNYSANDHYKFFLDLGPLKNVKTRYFGDSIRFWNDLVTHGTYDDFWKSRLITPHLKKVHTATLVVGGFFDAEDCYGAFATYQALEKQNKNNKNTLVMGPWFHGGWARSAGDMFGDIKFGQATSLWYQEKVEFPFFQHYLKGQPAPELPEALMFETGSNQWKSYQTWPPKDIQEQKLYFQKGSKLAFSRPSETESYDEYISDPSRPVPYTAGVHAQRTREYMIADQRFASRRPDVMVYQTEALTADVTLAGPVIADLVIATTGTDADFVVKLIDVFPDDYPNNQPNPANVQMGGYQMLVRGEVMRGKFRNSFEKPEPFIPGEITTVKYTLPDVAHTFKAGHRIMVQVQNSWFPLVDRNPQTFTDIYHADEKDFQKATQRIYHDTTNASGIILPVVK
ncbi:CocE/NonD family hydrolase [Pararcticibacter amylolyticus]|uniref:X-Pro dipeptidyl-peptidase n=1 Tax=Pararcticibacter amylolyticus TaxID=2173175 RepID=A0A2U2PF89_9SPHI|nr:CocE/NonD family hydrolase [Pararcticibacter amylolyticus]PWG80030.1 X-Pro dipeptidyl-peptidase [Pararcticibacter amylolyticus]